MTPLELFSFLGPLYRLVQSLSHGSWTAAFSGGLLPLAQLLWKWWHQRSLENQIEKLRQKVTTLHGFLNVLKDDADNLTAEKLFDDALRERAEALQELSKLAAAKELPKPSPSLVRRLFLFYTPTGIASLIFHTIFYLCLSVTFLLLGLLVPIGLSDRSALAGFEIGIGVWGMLLLVIRTVAVAIDRVGPPSRLERWLLLYKPERPVGWVLRGLFYVGVVLTVLLAVVIAPFMRIDQDSGMALLGFSAFVAVPASLRILIAHLERNRKPKRSREPNYFEKWFLLYRPSGISGWILRTVFYLSTAATILMLVVSTLETKDPDEDIQGLMMALGYLVSLSIVSRGVTTTLEQEHQPTRFDRLFLFYRPTRKIGWFFRALFYMSLVFALGFLAEIPWIKKGPDSEGDLTAGIVAALLAVLFRTVAVASDRTGEASLIERWLLLYRPARRAGWILHGLFYFSAIGAAAMIVSIWDESGSDRYIVLGAFASYIGFVVIFRGLAVDFEPNRQLSAEPGPFRRALLLHPPSRRVLWVPQILFYLMLMSLLEAVGFAFNEPDITTGLVYMAFVLLAIRQFVAGYDSSPASHPAWARWLMLGRPSHPLAWVPRTILYCAVVALPPMIVALFSTSKDQLALRALGENANFLLRVVVPTVLIALAAHGWAESYELPVASGTFSPFSKIRSIRNALLLNVPCGRVGWVPLTLFYLATIAFIVTLTHFPLLRTPRRFDRTILEIMLFSLLVSARGWARRYGLTGGNAEHVLTQPEHPHS